MINPDTTEDLHTLEAEIRAARLQALRRWVVVLAGLVLCLSLGACGGGEPEPEQPRTGCWVDGKLLPPEVCR